MLQTLLRLFVPKAVEPDAGDGKVTLGDVLRKNWFDLWYQPKIDLRTSVWPAPRRWCARGDRTAA